MHKAALSSAVFLAGAVVMGLELIAARVVAPFFGTAIPVWASLIGIVLAFLSVGYSLGGLLADRGPCRTLLAGTLEIAAVCIVIAWLIKEPVLTFAAGTIADGGLGALASAAILFAPANIFLGAVGPLAIKLSLKNVESAGEAAGNLGAVSTLGSLAGTFLFGYVALIYLGSSTALLTLAVLASAAGAIVYPTAFTSIILIVLALLALVRRATPVGQNRGVLVDRDTAYSRIQVIDEKNSLNGLTVRSLQNGPCGTQGAVVFREGKHSDNGSSSAAARSSADEMSPLHFLEIFNLFSHFNRTAQPHLLLLGAGAYVYPRIFLESFPAGRADVVEIDPALTELAKSHFFVTDDDRLTVHHEDARVFLNRSRKRYDAIIVDVFNSACKVPAHVLTIEAVKRQHSLLARDGVTMVNLISALEGPEAHLLWAAFSTYARVFSQVHVLQLDTSRPVGQKQNVMLLAQRSPEVTIDARSANAEIGSYLKHVWKGAIPSVDVLSDDYAPVDL